MPVAVLITQCLQRDFVAPLEPHEPLPNRLHVGREEALRLLGYDPKAGPVAQLMSWARQQSPEVLSILHIRDWHDRNDPRQHDHLAMFGDHCLRDTAGASLILGLDDDLDQRPNERVIHSIALTDFEDTDLLRIVTELQRRAGNEPLRVGVVGVWTEAKVMFLLYDLKTRCRLDTLATCSALTASASRTQHFNAIEQLRKILGVSCFDSVGEFVAWLVPGGAAPRPPALPGGFRARLEAPDGQPAALGADDHDLLGYLYRDSSRVTLAPLSGGFSGAAVFRVNSYDAFGHEQAPSVAKLGPRGLIGAERVAFERVEAILGNNAPSVRGFVDLGERAGIKYAYAAMGQGDVRTLKSLFETGAPQEQLDAILRTVFEEILGRFYAAAQYERLPLLEHYGFAARLAPRVRENVARIVGGRAARERLVFGRGYEVANLCGFYENWLAGQTAPPGENHYLSYVHGDLNGANVLIDGRENVWLIDFFHTGRGHVLKDIAKVENDLLYIFTPVANEAELEEALALTRALREVEDLQQPLPERLPALRAPAFVRAWATLRTLRALTGRLCRDDRHPLQLSIALLRYAAHTLTFEESSPLQKVWALAAACGHAEDVVATSQANRKLRVDWVDAALVATPGRLGMTLCPGRRDRGRALDADLDVLRRLGAKKILCLATSEELYWAGVSDLRSACEARGLQFRNAPIPDQGVPTLADAEALMHWIGPALAAGEDVVVHCIGGLGRTGTVAACALVARGVGPEQAIAAVRRARGPRAIETRRQERFVAEFAAARGAAPRTGSG